MENIYNLYNLIGKNLTIVRKEHKDTQEQLAEKIDKTRGFISHIEAPGVDTGVSIDTLFLIATTYNIDIRRFFDGYEELK